MPGRGPTAARPVKARRTRPDRLGTPGYGWRSRRPVPTSTPAPAGRIRSAFAPGGARTLRVDGPGWSLVARTDDIAFVLLDEEPGEIIPVGRGPELPKLLKALDELAVRPS